MKNKKTAFSIPELLIFMTIVGVICVLMMTIIKPNERYIPYAYYSAYDALSTAVYNIKEDAITNNMDNDESIKTSDKYFPGAEPGANGITAVRELCKKLANNPDNDTEYGYINTTEYNCEKFSPVDAITNITTSSLDSYAFRATNSMKFYISNMGSLKIEDALNNDAQNEYNYFLVWVDLNGDRKPNTAISTVNRPADIVPFMIFTNGNVVPVGNPVTDTRYMTARIQYPGMVTKYSLESYSYAEAVLRAYGHNEFPTYDMNSILISAKNGTQLYNNLIEEIDGSIQFDMENCAFEEDNNNPPACTVVIDQNRRL